MNNLDIIKQQLMKAMNQLDNWKLRGYDTPQLTYHEQLDMYHAKIENLLTQLKEEMK